MQVDFSAEGYQDGFEDNETYLIFDTLQQQREYRDAFERGQRDREEVQRASSSNA